MPSSVGRGILMRLLLKYFNQTTLRLGTSSVNTFNWKDMEKLQGLGAVPIVGDGSEPAPGKLMKISGPVRYLFHNKRLSFKTSLYEILEDNIMCAYCSI
ncbi:hypothetical protein PoB_002423300 [Plakobranchus ocellatus]|uniref:Uncharacterized protein n=1 Tax=Plakobranchus ocellatus TaxID=259542 RepID=A0AAV3ZS99_9GAST|nr:hypothetical protein PoB_002423300 [Plakobranchus ocellatus]